MAREEGVSIVITQAGLGLTQISKHAEQALSGSVPSAHTFAWLPQPCLLKDQRTVGRTVGKWPETGSSLVRHFPHPTAKLVQSCGGDSAGWQQLCPQEALSQPHWVLAEVVSVCLRVAMVF